MAPVCNARHPVGASLLAMLLICGDRQQAGSYKALSLIKNLY
jgi:hypothetical protein